MTALFGFEAVSIQNYILTTGKLKGMIGGSELVNRLGETNFPRAIEKLGWEMDKDVWPARTSGGALTLFFPDPEKARQFQSYWTVLVQKEAPGLRFTNGIVSVDAGPAEAMERLYRLMQQNRNRAPAILPLASPMTKRNARTGLPSVWSEKMKEEFWDEIAQSQLDAGHNAKGLTSKLIPKSIADVSWPEQLIQHEDEDEDGGYIYKNGEKGALIAVVHADGNGLGQIIKGLRGKMPSDPRTFAQAWLQFSEAIENATYSATRAALSHMYQPTGKTLMPCRPLILGGDDVTMILRADLALDFVEHFLVNFEQHSKNEFEPLRRLDWGRALPEKLTACAGFTYIKARQPFHQAYNLSEALCVEAKQASKLNAKKDPDGRDYIPSSLCFHRITSGLSDNWDQVKDRDLIQETRDPETGQVMQRSLLTMMPYGVGDHTGELPKLAHLHNLSEVINKLSRGAVRELARVIRGGDDQEMQRLRRWQENLVRDGQETLLSDLKAQFEALIDRNEADHVAVFTKVDPKAPEGMVPERRTPVNDLLALRALDRLPALKEEEATS